MSNAKQRSCVECEQIADIERNAFLNNCLCVTVRAKIYRNYSFKMINYVAMIIGKCDFIPSIGEIANSK